MAPQGPVQLPLFPASEPPLCQQPHRHPRPSAGGWELQPQSREAWWPEKAWATQRDPRGRGRRALRWGRGSSLSWPQGPRATGGGGVRGALGRRGWGGGWVGARPGRRGGRSVFPLLRFACCPAVLSNRGAVIHRLRGLLLGFQEQAGPSRWPGAPGGPGVGSGSGVRERGCRRSSAPRRPARGRRTGLAALGDRVRCPRPAPPLPAASAGAWPGARGAHPVPTAFSAPQVLLVCKRPCETVGCLAAFPGGLLRALPHEDIGVSGRVQTPALPPPDPRVGKRPWQNLGLPGWWSPASSWKERAAPRAAAVTDREEEG